VEPMPTETTFFEQLKQLATATWDGHLISKEARTRLVNAGYAQQAEGWNWLTKAGLEVLIHLGVLKP
jgi:hypothetical protein